MNLPDNSDYEKEIDERKYFPKSRLENFSDGVFAILITLLVLELRSPHLTDPESSSELLSGLQKMTSKYLGGFISFFSISVIWVNHYRFFKNFRFIDRPVVWLNALLLLCVTFLPFPTAVLGDYPFNRVAVMFYGATMTAISLVFSYIKIYSIREGHMFLDKIIVIRRKKIQYLFDLSCPIIYLAASLAAFAEIYISYAIYIGMPVYMIFVNMPYCCKCIQA